MSGHDYDAGCDCKSCLDDRKHNRSAEDPFSCVECGDAWPCDVAVHVDAERDRG